MGFKEFLNENSKNIVDTFLKGVNYDSYKITFSVGAVVKVKVEFKTASDAGKYEETLKWGDDTTVINGIRLAGISCHANIVELVLQSK